MQNLDAQTDMSQNQVGSCSNGVDVQFAEGNAGGARGATTCLSLTGSICQSNRVVISLANIQADGGPLQLNLNKTSCHEVGHTAGLQHHNPPYGDCMVSGRVDSGHQGYNGHHAGHINLYV